MWVNDGKLGKEKERGHFDNEARVALAFCKHVSSFYRGKFHRYVKRPPGRGKINSRERGLHTRLILSASKLLLLESLLSLSLFFFPSLEIEVASLWWFLIGKCPLWRNRSPDVPRHNFHRIPGFLESHQTNMIRLDPFESLGLKRFWTFEHLFHTRRFYTWLGYEIKIVLRKIAPT